MKVKVIFSLFLLVAITSVNADLKVGYYNEICPQAEKIVREVVEEELGIPFYNVGVGPGLVRLLFHDSFVGGCDGSVLLGSPMDSWSEKSASKNIGLRGFEIIDKAKQRLEDSCRGVVSCADILVFAARDATQILLNANYGYIEFNVESGRLDSKVSFKDQVDSSLPAPEDNLEQLKNLFLSKKDITVQDLVVLSGAHTFGQSHCSSIKDRIYPSISDTLNERYGYYLRTRCPQYVPFDGVVDLDARTPYKLDSVYYQNVKNLTALFFSDWSMLTGDDTLPFVNEYAAPVNDWNIDFVESMKKLSRLNVITDPTNGEIRKICSKVNSY
ncbi:Peroxidase [Rhynchospora pubera]|nr:Peroxidase [Rhynchospora pubera]KAJ4791752.1 Peroxidase [Rhynchospora pubera]KAJ4815574.1 Peroxidase [Rhynchospora pubera]